MKTILMNTQQASKKYDIPMAKVNEVIRKENVPYDVIGFANGHVGTSGNITTYIFAKEAFEKAYMKSFKTSTQKKQSKAQLRRHASNKQPDDINANKIIEIILKSLDEYIRGYTNRPPQP